MEWLLVNTQIRSSFASLGGFEGDSYVVSDDCLDTLDEINYKLSVEDQTLRTFRRAIGFSQNIRNDIIPLLVHAKDEKIVEATIRILVNLTIPVECLLPVETMLKTDIGRHTIFELNRLLITAKESFIDAKTTKTVLEYIKIMLERDAKLSIRSCENINNCLLLLRNILHIPEQLHQNYFTLANTSMQNQIVWNLFTQSVDKLLIHLMSCAQRSHWSVTMVQLIALMYKDQHVNTLQKLLNIWFESSISESSEDNESNTSPLKQCSGDSSPMLTSDPTSDSSDNGGTSKIKSATSSAHDESTWRSPESEAIQHLSRMETAHYPNSPGVSHSKSRASKKSPIGNGNFSKTPSLEQSQSMVLNPPAMLQQPLSPSSSKQAATGVKVVGMKRESLSSTSELSDCGYGTQVENPESISTSSTEDYGKPAHQKPPPNQKQRFNAANKARNMAIPQDKTEWRRKKFVKRSRSNMLNTMGLIHHTPTDEDISNILKEFTVDFLLRGYGYLVQELHAQLLTDMHLQIDTSHFFWLVSYFLKFAAQLELDLEPISIVLSFDVIGYLTYEAASLCEQLELTARQTTSDLKPCLRRMHLVVTAIREFLQAMESYKKIGHLSQEDKELLKLLQLQIASTNDLKFLFILLLRKYNPNIHSKQYLQDLIVTNHMLLLLLDNVAKMPEFKGNFKITDHIKHFATVEIMYQYGYLLEDFNENGEFVNDCVFTMMHHIGGDLGQVTTLFQPIILKTFSRIWEMDYELCDDWSDLVEYVIHKFINTPQNNTPLEGLSSAEFNVEARSPTPTMISVAPPVSNLSIWAQDDIDTLYWYYVQSKKTKDPIGHIVKQFEENENKIKSRIDVIQQLLQQDIITLTKFDDLMKIEDVNYVHENRSHLISTDESGIEIRDNSEPIVRANDDIQILREQLVKMAGSDCLVWLQEILLECCFIKLNMKNGKTSNQDLITDQGVQVMEPIPYIFIMKKQSIPIIPCTSSQIAIASHPPFMLMLHKLGFHLAADAGKLFVRVPDFWTEDYLYSIALRLGPLKKCHVKFDLSLLNIPQGSQNPATVSDEHHEPTSHFAVARFKKANAIIRFTPEPPTHIANWMQIVLKNRITHRQDHNLQISSDLGEAATKAAIPGLLSPKTEPKSCETPPSPPTAMDLSQFPMNAVADLQLYQLANRSTTIGPVNQDPIVDRVADIDIKAPPLTGCSSAQGEMADNHDAISTCESASVASDLTRMYVSDEDDRIYKLPL